MKILFIPSGEIIAVNVLSKKNTLLRCKQGLYLWNNGNYDRIIVSGGIYMPPNNQTIPAGALMKIWLIDDGVNENKIIVENHSLDTFENVKFGLREIREHGIKNPKITIVTQWQHALRFKICFHLGYGIKVKLHPMRYQISLEECILEFIGIIYCLCDPTGHGSIAKKTRQKRRQKRSSA